MYCFILLLCSIVSTLYPLNEYPKKMVINVPIVNLRFEPQAIPNDLMLPTSDLTNPLQITQLFLGEYIIANNEHVDKNSTTWLKVNTLQQEQYNSLTGWQGHSGWIQADQTITVDTYPKNNLVIKSYLANIVDKNNNKILTLSIGTRLCGFKVSDTLWSIILPDQSTALIHSGDVYEIDSIVFESTDELRKNIIATAIKFIGNFYSWGGRSAQNEKEFGICSVDCSAMIHLSFLSHGLQIPRMSHEQFLRSEKIELGKDLQPGDFVFFSSLTRYQYPMDHIMLYVDKDILLESTFADDHIVRTISFEQRIGKSVTEIKSGDIITIDDEELEVYFSSFLNNYELVQTLRNNALNNEY